MAWLNAVTLEALARNARGQSNRHGITVAFQVAGYDSQPALCSHFKRRTYASMS